MTSAVPVLTMSSSSSLSHPQKFSAPQFEGRKSHCGSMEEYERMHKESLESPDTFWGNIAKTFHWEKLWDGPVTNYNFNVNKGPIDIKWFEGGKTNICYNALDRHVVAGHGNRIAYHFEGNDESMSKSYTYQQLLDEVCKFANSMKEKGIKKGDVVILYLPMIMELAIATLACARIGAIHSVVFAGFSSSALSARIFDCKAKLVITADGVCRGTKTINLRRICDEALAITSEQGYEVPNLVCVRWTNLPMDESKYTYSWWHDSVANTAPECLVEWNDAEDPLFLLYTSGSTGTPKGVIHTTGGYMVYAATTTKYSFDYQQGDVFWCTADIGWITGHSYIVYGPLLNGATSVFFEGIPTFPDAGRFWQVVEKYKVTQFYTAPTAIRMLMKFDVDEYVNKYDLSSLRVLGTVGEPINPEAWMWYYAIIGKTKCAVVDTYWQTETGGHVVTPLPRATPTKPGSCCRPFFGVKARILNFDGQEAAVGEEGFIVFDRPWPGLMRTLYNNHDRYQSGYFQLFPGYYSTGDGGKIDQDGYLWVEGRVDDVMSVSGHRLGTAEIEAAITIHHDVVEAAAVGIPHDIKGQEVCVLVILRDGTCNLSPELLAELKQSVREEVGAFASPGHIIPVFGLPKTRSGKIMRRILRKLTNGDPISSLGDTSTLAEPAILSSLVECLIPLTSRNDKK